MYGTCDALVGVLPYLGGTVLVCVWLFPALGLSGYTTLKSLGE